MCACAGSSTEAPAFAARTSVSRGLPLASPRNCPARGRDIFRHFAGQVRMDRAPGRIGFMSTQRRESRWRRTSCTERRNSGWSFAPDGVQREDPGRATIPTPASRRGRANASGGTAPPGIPARLATNSLHSGCRIVQLVQSVRVVPVDLHGGSPPFGASRGTASGSAPSHGSSLPLIPSPSGFVRFHPSLPRVPAGRRRRAERYDGKRDMHLQHAA